jgi:hydroxymethylglutaryl-CoA lyase
LQIVEVGPRDGLQNEPRPVTTAWKRELIEGLIDAGLRRLEVASFVNPRRVPQMADAEELIAALPSVPGCTYIGLALNLRGAERALAAGVHEIGTVVPATDAFGTRNQGQSSIESIDEIKKIVSLGKAAGTRVLSAISMAFGCPFEGTVAEQRVIELARRIADAGISEIALADTIGVAVPAQVTDLCGRVRDAVPHLPLRTHFHDTRNTAIANVWAAVQAKVDWCDSAIAGLGGCPFAPGATGNVATEDVIYLLERSGLSTTVNLERLIELSRNVNSLLERRPGSGLSLAGIPRQASQSALG